MTCKLRLLCYCGFILYVDGFQIDEGSDVEKKRKNYKSDSEIYTEPRSSARHRKSDSRSVEKYKKIHLDVK